MGNGALILCVCAAKNSAFQIRGLNGMPIPKMFYSQRTASVNLHPDLDLALQEIVKISNKIDLNHQLTSFQRGVCRAVWQL